MKPEKMQDGVLSAGNELPAGWLICISAASVSFHAIEAACLTKWKGVSCTEAFFRFISVVLTTYPNVVRGFNRTVTDRKSIVILSISVRESNFLVRF